MKYNLSSGSAIVISAFLASLFVVSIYSLPAEIRALPRNDPVHIKYRLVSVGVVSVVSPLILYLFMINEGSATVGALFGFRLNNLIASIFVPILHTIILFLGPIAERTVQYSHTMNHLKNVRFVHILLIK